MPHALRNTLLVAASFALASSVCANQTFTGELTKVAQSETTGSEGPLELTVTTCSHGEEEEACVLTQFSFAPEKISLAVEGYSLVCDVVSETAYGVYDRVKSLSCTSGAAEFIGTLDAELKLRKHHDVSHTAMEFKTKIKNSSGSALHLRASVADSDCDDIHRAAWMERGPLVDPADNVVLPPLVDPADDVVMPEPCEEERPHHEENTTTATCSIMDIDTCGVNVIDIVDGMDSCQEWVSLAGGCSVVERECRTSGIFQMVSFEISGHSLKCRPSSGVCEEVDAEGSFITEESSGEGSEEETVSCSLLEEERKGNEKALGVLIGFLLFCGGFLAAKVHTIYFGRKISNELDVSGVVLATAPKGKETKV